MRNFLLFMLFAFAAVSIAAQRNSSVVSGPMLGHTELRTSQIWIELKENITQASVKYWEKTKPESTAKKITLHGKGEFPNIYTFVLTALEPATTYQYKIFTGSNTVAVANGEVKTQQLWQYRKPASDFSFLTGSCAYFNEPVYDRPGKPYGGDISIFETMANENADFMLWLGDNWYTREADYHSVWGLNYRASRDRSLPMLQNFWKEMPQYAIWDDHDYGPNDANKSYVLKDASRSVFMKYWCNPSYGMNGNGIYTKLSWNDVDIFMLDDRWFRSDDELPDSVNNMPNASKKMFGDEQIEWLKNALLFSKANTQVSFRIIATGSQVLNPLSPWDCFRHFPAEYYELMKFIADNKINGIVFLTGDRHHSEIIKTERAGTYPLFDITSSPLTSGIGKTRGAEESNPFRVSPEIDEQNYARISFSGEKKERKMKVEFISLKGEKLSEWSISVKELTGGE